MASESPMLGPSAWRQVPEWHSSPARDMAVTRISVHAACPAGAP
jgi:hypothetical protein